MSANINANINGMVNANALNAAIKEIKAKNAASQSNDEKRRLPKLEAKLAGLSKPDGNVPVSVPANASKSVSVTNMGTAKTNANVTGLAHITTGNHLFKAAGGRRKRTRRAKKAKRTRRHR